MLKIANGGGAASLLLWQSEIDKESVQENINRVFLKYYLKHVKHVIAKMFFLYLKYSHMIHLHLLIQLNPHSTVFQDWRLIILVKARIKPALASED